MAVNTPENVGRAVLNRDAMVYPSLRDLVDSGYLDCRDTVVDGRPQAVCRLTTKGKEAYLVGAEAWEKARQFRS